MGKREKAEDFVARTGAWTCNCGATNAPWFRSCPKCGAPKIDARPPQTATEGSNGWAGGIETPKGPQKAGKRQKRPNKTESRWLEINPDPNAAYEGITLRLANGHRYTPDWYLPATATEKGVCVEVKNAAYRHASYGRARLAFDQAKIEHPEFVFVWAELQKNGTWK